MPNLKRGEFKQVLYGVGNTMYVTPCVDCGQHVPTWVKRTDVVYKCKECREKEKDDKRLLQRKISSLMLLRRVDKAKEIITRAYGNLDGYKHALGVVEKNLDKPGWFQSTNEVLVAMELIRSRVKARHQVKMGKWRVDFVLPEMKVVLEIDGAYHDGKERKEKDRLKEGAIIANLGASWEVVHIRDDILKKNPQKLVPAIQAVLEGRMGIRKTHLGQLPKTYSQTH